MPVDTSVSRCPLCGAEFKFTRRRHWCRSCGATVCRQCSTINDEGMFSFFMKRHEGNMCRTCAKRSVQVVRIACVSCGTQCDRDIQKRCASCNGFFCEKCSTTLRLCRQCSGDGVSIEVSLSTDSTPRRARKASKKEEAQQLQAFPATMLPQERQLSSAQASFAIGSFAQRSMINRSIGSIGTPLKQSLIGSFAMGSVGSLPPDIFKRIMALSNAPQRNWTATANQRMYLAMASTREMYRSVAFVLEGQFERTHLKACLQLLLQRHELLRGYLQGEQFVIPQSAMVDFVFIKSGTVEDVSRALKHTTLFRAIVVPQHVQRSHLVLLRIHWAIADLDAIVVLLEDLRTLYQNSHDIVHNRDGDAYIDSAVLNRVLPPLRVGLPEVVASEAPSADDGAYWTQLLSGANSLGLDLPIGSGQVSHPAFASDTFTINADVTRHLGDVARSIGASMKHVFLALFAALLHSYCGAPEEMLVATSMSNRAAQFSDVLVPLSNYVLHRIRTDPGTTLADVIGRARSSLNTSEAYGSFPFAKILELIGADVTGKTTFPVCQAVFEWEDRRSSKPSHVSPMLGRAKYPSTDWCGLKMYPWTDNTIAPNTTPFAISLSMWDVESDVICGTFQFASVAKEVGNRMSTNFVHLATIAVASVNKPLASLQVASRGEVETMVVSFNDVKTPFSFVPVHEMMEHSTVKWPNANALVFPEEDVTLTYQELNDHANRLARILQQHGVGRNVAVAICMDRGPWQLTCVLAVCKSGGVVLSLDPSYPPDRLTFMLEDSDAAVVLTSKHIEQHHNEVFKSNKSPCIYPDKTYFDAISDTSAANLNVEVQPDDQLYLVYTSGSTGKPKGVVMRHEAIANLVDWQNRSMPGNRESRCLQFSSSSFDVAYQEYFTTWSHGGVLYGISELLRRDALNLLQFLVKHDIERMYMPFVALAGLCEAAQEISLVPKTLKDIISSGEQVVVSNAVVWLFEQLGKGSRFHNQYGPCETHVVSYYTMEGNPRTWPALPPIGYPISNCQLYVLNDDLTTVPLGSIGELYIAGYPLGLGYLKRPDTTNATFVPCPFANAMSKMMYKTGDIVRLNTDYVIEYVRRKDHQVKFRGFRVELGEIEARLMRCPLVRKCAVIIRNDVAKDARMVGYVVPSSKSAIDAGALRDYLKAQVPEYMVPSIFVFMDVLPTTPSGKINRKGLPKVSEDDVANQLQQKGKGGRGPRTATEEALSSIWEEVLGATHDVDSNFFEVGGHSLSITKVLARIKTRLKCDMPLATAFQCPTISAMAAYISEAKEMEDDGGIETDYDSSALTMNQKSMLFLHNSNKHESGVYNIVLHGVLEGDVDFPRVQAAFSELLHRHPSLRTRYVEVDGAVVPHVEDNDELDVNVFDFESEQLDRGKLRDEANKPFDLSRDSLLRVRLFRFEDAEVLQLVVHHIACDLWSLVVMFGQIREFLGRSRGPSPTGSMKTLPNRSLKKEYAAYAGQQQRYLAKHGAVALGKWMEQLACTAQKYNQAPLELPSDFHRPSMMTRRGGLVTIELPHNTTTGIRALIDNRNTTLYTVLMSTYFSVLHLYCGREDLVVGTPMACRTDEAFENTVGYFVNSLPLRMNITSASTFEDVLDACRAQLVAVMELQEFPFPLLVDKIVAERSTSHSPIFQTLFVLQKPHELDELTPFLLHKDGCRLQLGENFAIKSLGVHSGMSMFDLTVQFAEVDGQLVGNFEYNADIFTHSTIEAIASTFAAVAESACQDPSTKVSSLTCLTPGAKDILLNKFNSDESTTKKATAVTNYAEHFRKVAQQYPDAVALRFGVSSVETMTYAELDTLTDSLAVQFLGHVPQGSIIGVGLKRSINMCCTFLAIVKAGCCYVPLDPAYPEDRLRHMVNDSGAALIVSGTHHIFEKLTDCPMVSILDLICAANARPAKPTISISGDALAYMIYTSGSTGLPKGVLLENRNMMHMVFSSAKSYNFSAGDVMLLFASSSFDAAALEIFSPLACGGTVAMLSEDPVVGEDLAIGMSAAGVTHVVLPPPVLGLMQEDFFPSKGLKVLLTAGEAINENVLRRWRGSVMMMNAYGPTENSVLSTTCRYDEEKVCLSGESMPGGLHVKTPPIGHPVPGSKAYVVNPHTLQLAPLYAPGELLVSGLGVARGYHNRPEKTEECFIPNPFDSRYPRMYRTGDLVRWLPGGTLEYLGRIDSQVKIRGYRIELGEIESVLGELNSVATAVCDVKLVGGEKTLVAYLVLSELTSPQAVDLRTAVAAKLPQYMIPAYFVVVSEIPVTPNGKVNRHALPLPDGTNIIEDAKPTAHGIIHPRTATETALLAIFQEVLGSSQLSTQASFFDFGGHSLAAMQLTARVRDIFQVEVPLTKVFEVPTVVGIADFIDSVKGRSGALVETEHHNLDWETGTTLFPMSVNQEALWLAYCVDPDSTAFSVILAARLNAAEVDVGRLRMAFTAFVLINPPLRSRFGETSEHVPYQRFPMPFSVSFNVDSCSDARARVTEIAQMPFNLRDDNPLRIRLVRSTVDSTEAYIVVAMHHIVSDLVSVELLVSGIDALLSTEMPTNVTLTDLENGSQSIIEMVRRVVNESYEEVEVGSPIEPCDEKVPYSYIDFAQWQKDMMASSQGEYLLGYWIRALAGHTATLALPNDLQRPPMQTYSGGNIFFSIDSIATEFKEATQSFAATSFSVLVACLYSWLFRATGQQDILMGTPVAGRLKTEFESVFGDFVNLVCLRAEMNERSTFRSLIRDVKQTVINALVHQECPFATVVKAVQQHRDVSRSPLFQVLIVLERPHHSRDALAPFILGDDGGQMDVGDMTWQSLHMEETSTQYDLVFAFTESSSGMTCRMQYNTDLFSSEFAKTLPQQLLAVATDVLRNYDKPLKDASLLSPEEEHFLRVEYNKTARPFPDVVQRELIHQRHERCVAKYPDNIAVEDQHTTWTYREFGLRCNALARYLRGTMPAKGVVAVLCPRSAHYVLSIISAAKAGLTYVPIDVSIPSDRLQYVVGDATCCCVLTVRQEISRVEKDVVTQFPNISVVCVDEFEFPCEDPGNLDPVCDWTDPVYIIYTSGSTGRPKGVKVHHGGVVNVCSRFEEDYAVTPADRRGQVLGAAFDPVTYEIWPALRSGAAVVVMDDEAKLGGVDKALAFVRQKRITLFDFPTALSEHTLNANLPDDLSVRVWYCGGEKMHGTAKALPFLVVNSYGPTEASVLCSCYHTNFNEVPKAALRPARIPDPGRHAVDPPIGKPISNCSLYIADSQQRLLPWGLSGELLIGGNQVAIGYVNRPDATESAFIPDVFGQNTEYALQPPRLYRTGDVVKFTKDYDIEFVGRIDFQVKVRGYRIELGEIQSVLADHPAVENCAVVARSLSEGTEKKVLAYVVLAAGYSKDTFKVSELAQILKGKLPDYMVPSYFTVMDILPLTINGKVDREKLPTPETTVGGVQYEAPRDEIEHKLVAIWEEMLQVKPIGRLDNWYDKGGSSLTSTLLLARVRQVFQMEITLKQFFASPTLAGLATIARERGNADVADDVVKVMLEDRTKLTLPDLAQLEPCTEEVQSVFLTGATGFLGVFLLCELLKTTKYNVFCLVRAKTDAEGQQRIVDALEKYKLVEELSSTPDAASRIIPVIGDLAKQNFGITSQRFTELCQVVDVILHNGALVNFSYPYVSLRAANVDGTQTALTMATTHHLKPVHYVSTLSVVSTDKPGELDETELGDPEHIDGGYSQSKWVAEQLIIEAARRGVPVTIHRPGRITGHSVTGATNVDDFLNLLLKGCVQMKAAPRMKMPCEMTPVDLCAKAIIALSLLKPVCNDHPTDYVFHLFNNSAMEWNDIVDCVKDTCGYSDLATMPFTTWRSERLLQLTGESHNALLPLVPVIPEDFEDEVAHPSRHTCTNTMKLLRDFGVVFPTTGPRLLAVYIAFLKGVGFLPAQ